MGKENITITINGETLDIIRKQAVADYRSINKQIAYLIDLALSILKQQQKGLK
jgi:hypothetical protein